MTTFPISRVRPAKRDFQLPNGWWLLPSILGGAGIWIATLTALFF